MGDYKPGQEPEPQRPLDLIDQMQDRLQKKNNALRKALRALTDNRPFDCYEALHEALNA